MSKILKNYDIQITQNYSDKHKGIDIVGYKNKADYICAYNDGVVTVVKTGYTNDTNLTGTSSWGNRVMIKHDNYYTHYCHLKNVSVKQGDKVKKGEVIGYMGNSGNAKGVHLHFEVYKGNTRINPTSYITEITYSAYDNVKNKWLSKVTKGTSEYAGNIGNAISAIKIDNLTYRVHDKIKNKWLPWVIGSNSYAGNLPNDIDAIQIKDVTYRAYDGVKKKWLPWINGTNGYAGNISNAINAFQIK